MTDSNVFPINTATEDALNEVLRQGAQELLAKAVAAELARLLERYCDLKVDGKQAVVRNGYLPERVVHSGIGEVAVKVPKVRDRSGSGIKFNSALLPPYLKRTKTLEEFFPWLYLKGVSTGDMQPALERLRSAGISLWR